MASNLIIDALTRGGGTISLPLLEVKDDISIKEAMELIADLLNSSDKQGLRDTVVLLNAYLVIELGPKECKLVWDKLLDKNLNDVTELLRCE